MQQPSVMPWLYSFGSQKGTDYSQAVICTIQACRRGFQAEVPRLVTDSHSPIAWHLDCYQLWPMLASVRATVNGINALHPGHQVAPSLAITISLPRHEIISYSASASTQATIHFPTIAAALQHRG